MKVYEIIIAWILLHVKWKGMDSQSVNFNYLKLVNIKILYEMKIFNVIYIVNKSDVFEKMTLKKKILKILILWIQMILISHNY